CMQATAPKPKRSWTRSLLLLAAVLGPGFVTASAGNDVGGIATYSQAGAVFGYSIIWVLVPLAVALIVVQEMSTRMGCVTGKGLAALFRENFGVKISVISMLVLFLINTLITTTEFAGIAAASEMLHISRYIAVPAALVIVFLFVLRFNNKVVERTFVVLSLIYLAYIASAILAKPDWHAVVHGALVPTFEWHTAGWLAMVVGIIGTTISPYMQFFLQSQVVEKGSRAEDLPLARADVINGSILAIALAGFMEIACAATIFVANAKGAHLAPTQAADFAKALAPLAGNLAATIFALGILNAGLFTATVLPLSTSYIICEAMGFEAAVDRKFSEAPVFFVLFAAGLIIGAAAVLIPGVPLLRLILYSQVLQGILLPLELVLMLIIINRKSVMGAHTNGTFGNVIGWGTAIIIGALSIVYVAGIFIPQLLGG
ncbi:MAG TPA: Nramp family divalent metal transporter, partial [Candidatus Baltobacteraceae bacterium]|nr:Nramp family divalent metal transporter [Candidatus Baltobacteraceae bacterium]